MGSTGPETGRVAEKRCATSSGFAFLAAMTKSEIIDRVADGTGLTKLETEAVINGFLKTVVDALAAGESVELRGFGTFRVKERAPRVGRNPKTGKIVEIDTQYVPHVKLSREVRRVIDEAIKQAGIQPDSGPQSDDD